MKIEKHTLMQERCELLDCTNNNNGYCACINMPHTPEDGVECDSYISED